MAEMCKALYDYPDSRLKLIGITGTKGKSSVGYLLHKCLTALLYKSAFFGTLGIYGIDCRGIKLKANTTQDASVIYPLLKRCLDEGVSFVILEVSSQALKELRVFGLEFEIVAFTSFSKDHIGGSEHRDISEYISTKRLLFSSYGADKCVENFDDPYASYFSSDVKTVVKCGTTPHSDFLISDIENSFSGVSFNLLGKRVNFTSPGKYNAVNFAIAAAIAQLLVDARLEYIIQKMENVKVPGRFEYFSRRGRNFIIDYAHNRESFREITSLARELTVGNIIAVFGSVGERSFDRRRELAEAAEELSDFSVITSDNPGYEDPNKIAYEIYSCFRDKTKAKTVTDRLEAIKYAFSVSSEGDSILLLGKGHEKYMNILGKSVPFSEREIIKKL